MWFVISTDVWLILGQLYFVALQWCEYLWNYSEWPAVWSLWIIYVWNFALNVCGVSPQLTEAVGRGVFRYLQDFQQRKNLIFNMSARGSILPALMMWPIIFLCGILSCFCLLFYLKGILQRKGDIDTHTHLPAAGSFPKWLQRLELSWSEGSSLESGISCGSNTWMQDP